MNLRSHLSRNLPLCFCIFLLHPTSFLNCMSQRFLTIHMFPSPHRCNRRRRMMVVRRADHHRINLWIAYHFAPIRRRLCSLKSFLYRLKCLPIDIAKGMDILCLYSIQVCSPSTPRADDSHIKFSVWRLTAHHRGSKGGSDTKADKLSSAKI